MTAMIFQNVAAQDEYNIGEDMDIFVDPFGNEHQVWREPVNGTYQIFYGYQIANEACYPNSMTYSNQTVNSSINFDDGDNPCPRIIYSAANEIEVAYSSYMDAFNEALGNDLNAYYVADLNSDGYVSITEAFDYSKLHTPTNPQEGGDTNLANNIYLGEYHEVNP